MEHMGLLERSQIFSDCWSPAGVDEEAALDDIIRAYRQRALEEHPDKGGDKDRFFAAWGQTRNVL